MKPLSIGVDARPLSHPNTGIGRYTHAILSRLTDAGHQFHLYGTEPLTTTFEGMSIRTHDGQGKRLHSTLLAQRLFPRWARDDGVDVFWSPRHHLPLGLRCPTLLTVHDLVWRKVPQTMTVFARLAEATLMAPSLRKAHRVISVSHSTRQDLSDWLPSLSHKVQVIHEAPCVSPGDLPQTPSDERPEAPYFLCVGTFEPRKNLARLVHAFAQTAQSLPHSLVLVGEQGWGPPLAETLADIGRAAERIHQLSPRSTASLAELFEGCNAFVYPSLYEGFGLPLAEAMAFAKPIVTARNSSLEEVAGDAAIYVDEQDVASIAEGMLRVASDDRLRITLKRNAKQRAATFSWDDAAARTLKALQDVAAGNPLPPSDNR